MSLALGIGGNWGIVGNWGQIPIFLASLVSEPQTWRAFGMNSLFLAFGRFSAALTLASIAGCSGSSQPLEVSIFPEVYQVGAVQSALATPVVDEVVQAKPQKILIVTCYTTHPRKIIQFENELNARHQAEVRLVLVEQCPIA